VSARLGLAIWVLAGCSFQGPTVSASAIDAPVVVPPDDVFVPKTRVRDHLIGLWTFDDAAGSTSAADTSGSTAPVDLAVITSPSIAAPVFSNGTLIVDAPARLYSSESTHLAADCMSAQAVTFEAWVMPKSATVVDPSFIGGLAANILERDVAMLQVENHWVAKVRTTAAADGTPDLVSTSTVAPTHMTHLVVVADATRRILYVDGVAEATGTAGAPLNWDLTFPMALVDEYQHARQWLGVVALAALYNRGLTSAEIQQNFELGPNAPD
jgi:hypothetical protein